MNKETIEQVRLHLDQAGHILITSHTRPDGDAIGSILAFGQALASAGKEVQMVSADGVPSALKFLPGSEKINNRPGETADMVIVLDSSNLDRVGNVLDDYNQIDLNVDHHPDNTNFAQINLVKSKAVSTTEILYHLISALELDITTDTAANLLTGMITDTIGFKTKNMHPEALRIAADLVEKGADLSSLYHHAIVEKTFEAARYMGAGLSQLSRENGLVWTSLTLENRRQAQYPGRDDADLVNILSSINSAEVALIFIEQDDGSVKISWRTRSETINVAAIAQQFGGGGHRAAAGAMISGSLEEVQASVISTTQSMIEK